MIYPFKPNAIPEHAFALFDLTRGDEERRFENFV